MDNQESQQNQKLVLWKINKIYQSTARFTKISKRLITNFKNERRKITTGSTDIKRVIKNTVKNPVPKKKDHNQDEKNKLLEK